MSTTPTFYIQQKVGVLAVLKFLTKFKYDYMIKPYFSIYSVGKYFFIIEDIS